MNLVIRMNLVQTGHIGLRRPVPCRQAGPVRAGPVRREQVNAAHPQAGEATYTGLSSGTCCGFCCRAVLDFLSGITVRAVWGL